MVFFLPEVTVRSSDLKPCKQDKKVCVIDPRDCGPRSPSAIESIHKHTLAVPKHGQTQVKQMFKHLS